MKAFWKTPPSNLTLSKEELHIWRATLDLPAVGIEALNQVLSLDEKIRAERFRFERDRRRFIAARGILRQILGSCLSVEPSAVRFCYGRNGKPRLADTYDNGKICFSLSHSQGIALYGFSRGRQVGVDIESIRDFTEMGEIARQFFSVNENEVFNGLPKSKKVDAFFKCWTRKEAFVKAIGDGLSYPLNMFDVSVDPGEPAELLRIRGDARKAARWSIQDVKTDPGLAAAFAVNGRSWRLRCWQ